VDQFVVISGCSGGGKSTLIAELGRRGYPVVEEPGRRIVKEELASGGSVSLGQTGLPSHAAALRRRWPTELQ
jgi:predicted ATPase